MHQHSNKLTHTFENIFKDIRTNKKLMNLFVNPFNMDPENIETSLQLKIIELQSNSYF